ncbi:histidine phosphatase family protein [Paracoccus aestuarii]|nr:histidine phosphatase family protein [Paracoccus aestuarii]
MPAPVVMPVMAPVMAKARDLPPLWLIRHGQTEWNLQGRLQGRGDSPLTAMGRAQARGLGPLARGLPGIRLTSPAGRARDTARLIFGTDIPADPRLAEICVGGFAGLCEDDLRARHPAVFAGGPLDWYDRCPGGEGFAALELRCRDLLAGLDGPAVLVTHGITLRMIRALAMGHGVTQGGPVIQGAVHHISHEREAVLHPPGFSA